MPGYDDPRYLQQVITQLQQKVKKLEKDTLPLLAYQRGPTPGWLAAGQVGPGPSMKSALHLHNDGNQVGVAPRLSITDANGVVRWEEGNLAANGVSPAQYGARANKADGTPLFDSLGLIATVGLLGSSLNFSQQSVTGNGSFQVVSGSSVSFTLTRATNILALGHEQLLDPTVGDTGYTLSTGIMVDNVFSTSNGPECFNTTTGALPITPFAVITSMAAGAHGIAAGVKQTNTHLWSVVSGYLYIFQLGA